jgi:hypothetical protein
MLNVSRASVESRRPQAQLMEMATAHWISRCLHTAAQMGLADQFSGKSKTADELATSTATHPSSLYRLLRTLAGLGVFTEDDAHRFALTPLGEALRTGTPGSVRSAVLTLAGELFTKSLDELHYSVQTGNTSFEKVFGARLFTWLADHPVEASMFSETMVGIHGDEPRAVGAAYDFSQFDTIVDVGGATGNLLTAILDRYAKPQGMLFDLPHVIRDAPPFIQAHGLKDRITIKAGNFFEGVPPGGDAYLLSHIIHDWNEAECLAILGNCRHAMKPAGRLLIVETVLPTGNGPHPGKMLDMIMLAIPGGQERTEPEYRVLLDKAGFRLERIVPTESAVNIVDARPV